MRNPNRIYYFIYHIGKLWQKYCPDWRFGQLMFNFLQGQDPFYWEETDFMKRFECYIYNEVASKPDPDDFIYYKKED